MLYLIDGTGPEDADEYFEDMDRGFCAQIFRRYGPGGAVYLRGPTLDGLSTWAIGDLMLGEIRSNPGSPIILVGHSRGGAAVIYVARKLREEGIRVKGMILFDAVRRAIQTTPAEYISRIAAVTSSPTLMAIRTVLAAVEVGFDYFSRQAIDVIPSNVERALHMIRNEEFSRIIHRSDEWKELSRRLILIGAASGEKQDAVISRLWELQRMHERMRDACRFNCATNKGRGLPVGFSFGNTGLACEPGCKLEPIEKNKMNATHGGMGGAPLDPFDYIKDRRYAQVIRDIEAASMQEVKVRAEKFLLEMNA